MRARFTRTSSGLTRTHTINAGVGAGNNNKRVATRLESAINMSNTLAGGNVNIAQHGGTPTFMGMMQGLAPETSPGQMAQLYRDCYYNDSIAGSTVDMSAMFPFSDYTLTGLSTAEIDLYEASLARLNMRSLMSEIGATYLADGAFIGSLVFDSDARTFQDVLVHDTAQAEISMQPLHTMDPVIKVNTASSLQNFFNSNSPYIDQMLSGYPRALIEGFMDGPTHLDPLSTLFIPRRGLQDRTHNSYLHRLIPIFLLEKVLYRGTLLELSRRQRSTTHVKMGDENWIPTDEELQSGLAEFQMTEYDPLGAWIATRQGIEINEIRSHSEFFKWTDIVETLVPLKLRALSISEAFLSGDACLAGDTLIATDKGLVRIDSAYDSRERNKVMPLNWKVKNFAESNTLATSWIYNGKRPVFRVTMNNGITIKGTENHQFLTNRGWVRLDSLTLGDGIGYNLDTVVVPGEVDYAQLASVKIDYKSAVPAEILCASTKTQVAYASRVYTEGRTVDGWLIGSAEFISSFQLLLNAIGLHSVIQKNIGNEVDGLSKSVHLNRKVATAAPELTTDLVRRDADYITVSTVHAATEIPDFLEVASIESAGEEDVFDLSMRESPIFTANGLLVHNSYSTAESAVNSFTDSMLSFRQLLTYKTFYSKVFPLIAVLNNLYKDTDKANVDTDTIAQVRRNLADISNLKIPTIQWHKSLEGKDSESQFDMLERLSEKGFVVPLRMWASAAGLDMSALMRDLAEDSDLKSKMEKLTGKRAETIGNEDKKGFDDDAFLGEGEAPTGEGSGAAGGADAQFQASINKTIASVTRPLSVAGGRARVPILARDMTHLDLPRNGKLSKSGNAVHAQYGDHRQDRIMNDKLIKALRALRDPEHAAKVRARRQETGASGPSIIPPGTFPAP